MSQRIAQRRTRNKCRSSNIFSLRVTQWQTSREKDGAMMDVGEMAQIRASTVHQKREEVHAAVHYAAGFHCLV